MMNHLFRHIALVRITALIAIVGVLSSVYPVIAVEVASTDNEMKLRGIASTRIGTTLDSNGDVNGDGYVDLLVGFNDNTTTTDTAALFYGSSEGFNITPSIVDADATFNGITGEGNSGGLVSFAGDVNNDGYDDMLVANSYANSATGDVFLIYGSATNYDGDYTLTSMSDSAVDRFQGEATANYAGASVAGVGDMNNDGYDDFAIGAHWNATKAGGGLFILWQRKYKNWYYQFK